MDPILYEGSPFDDYLRELDIAEDCAPAVDNDAAAEEVGSVEGLPGAYRRAQAMGGSGGKVDDKVGSAGGAWSRVLQDLPTELVALLCLTPPASQASVRQDYRYLLVSSSLLDSSLPRATLPVPSTPESSSAAASAAQGASLSGDGASKKCAAEYDVRTAAFRRVLIAAGLLIVSGAWAWLALLTFGVGPMQSIPAFNILGATLLYLRVYLYPSHPPPARSLRPRTTSLFEPTSAEQADAVRAIRDLVEGAEAFDRSCNAMLAKVWDAERSQPAPDVTPLLSLRHKLAEALATVQHHVENAHANLHPFTSSAELSILSKLYSLEPKSNYAARTRPAAAAAELDADAAAAASRDPTSPTRVSLHAVTPLRRIRTTTAQTKTTPVLDRFISPPPPRRAATGEREHAGAQLTMMPPRTPRLNRLAGGRSTPLAPARSPAVLDAQHVRVGAQGLLPSPQLSPRVRSPTPAESLVDNPRAPTCEDAVAPSPPPPSAALVQLHSADRMWARSAKRRSLQDIPYRHACSPLAQCVDRRLGPETPVQLKGGRRLSNSSSAGSPPDAIELLEESEDELDASRAPACRTPFSYAPTRMAHKTVRSSFSHSATRPVYGAHSPAAPRPRMHKSTLSTPLAVSPSVPDLQALAFAQQRAALALAGDIELDLPPLEDADEPSPTPLSHAALLAAFCELHARRRHILVLLLALRRDLALDAWAEVATFVDVLKSAFDEARSDVSRSLAVANQVWGGSESDAFAPRPRSAVELRRAGLSSLWDGVELLRGKIGALEEIVETGEGWNETWLELRDDLAELIRMWERSRAEMGIQGESTSLMGLPREVPVRPFDLDADDHNAPDDEGDAAAAEPREDVEDDVTRYLRETAATLPAPGREELFAAESAPATARRPPSKLTREERIRLAKAHRDGSLAAVEQAGKERHKGPARMGDVILELNGLMQVLRSAKGATAEKEQKKVPLSTDIQPSSQASNTPLAAPRLEAPFTLPLPPQRDRSSLPALSQGSSDGEADLDDSLEFLSPKHRDGSQVTLRAGGSDDEENGGEVVELGPPVIGGTPEKE